MNKNIIGRKQEISRLRELYKSNKPEFVTVFGRRLVGKTYLVRKMLEKSLFSTLQDWQKTCMLLP